MIAKAAIGVLAAIVLVLLYRGMHQERARVDPMSPISNQKILAVLQAYRLPCDRVFSYTPLGRTKDGDSDAYLARCSDGGRYVYFQNLRHLSAISCKDESFHFNYRCPN